MNYDKTSEMDLPPTTARSLLPKASSQDNSLDDVQLCFNRAHFNRRDFSVDRFVNLARRRASLDVIHNDLRVYLRFLQNSMIELINDDYADFLNLSSSLAVLKESIDKICTGFESSWNQFSKSTADIQSSAKLIQQKCFDLAANRASQIAIRNRIFLLLSIERLSRALANRSATLSSWLPKLSDLVAEMELWYSRVPEAKVTSKVSAGRQTCHSRIKKILIEELIADVSDNSFNNIANILRLVKLIGKDELAVDKIASSCVAQQLELIAESSGKFAMLTGLFEHLLRLREKWMNLLVKKSQSNECTASFLDFVLLRYCSNYLDEKFGSVFVPSDPALFHKCYERTADFVVEYARLAVVSLGPSLASRRQALLATLKIIIGKFNVVVYFKMITQECQVDVKRQSTPDEFAIIESVDENESKDAVVLSYTGGESPCRCILSRSILNALYRFFAGKDIYLPVLADRLWNFTLKCLNGYVEWASMMNEVFRSAAVDSEKSLHNLIILTHDVRLFAAHFTRIYTNVIMPRFSALRLTEFDSLNACVSIFTAKIDSLSGEIVQSVNALSIAKALNELTGVEEIPRQYRWTKRKAPTCLSGYLRATFAVCEDFAALATRVGWREEEIRGVVANIVRELSQEFCNKAEQVLEIVEQTGSSLQRFKRKMQNQGPDTSGAVGSSSAGGLIDASDSDEAKIRAQLAFDASFMRQRAVESNVDATRLIAFEQRVSGMPPAAGDASQNLQPPLQL